MKGVEIRLLELQLGLGAKGMPTHAEISHTNFVRQGVRLANHEAGDLTAVSDRVGLNLFERW